MISEEQKAALLARAEHELSNNRPVVIQTDLSTMLCVLGALQLALRHPGFMQRPSHDVAERFVVELIEQIDPEHGAVYEFLMAGLDERFDDEP